MTDSLAGGAKAYKADILVVDDMAGNLHLLQQILSAEGYKVRIQTTGARALVAVKAALPELILLDINLPEMDGIEVCRRLKADEKTRDVPVLFISAMEETRQKVEGFAAGGQDYIVKPFQREELLARIETHLALNRLQRSLLAEIGERKRAEAQAVRRAGQLAMLNRINKTITSGLQVDGLLETLYHECRQIAPMDRFYVALSDTKKTQVEFAFFAEGEQVLAQETLTFPQPPDVMGEVLVNKRSLYLPDVSIAQREGTFTFQAWDQGGASYLGIPLSSEKVTGVLSLQSRAQNAYSREQIEFLESVATQAAVALEHARLFQEVQWLAITDSLTGIFNRRHFMALASQEIGRALRFHYPLGLLLLDIDHFKQINDTYGHQAGDQALRQLTGALRATLRRVDLLGRYGGEEFIILLPDTVGEEAVRVAERLREEVEKMTVYHEGRKLSVTISAGVANLVWGKNDGLEAMISRADQALYRAKACGRNCVHLG